MQLYLLLDTSGSMEGAKIGALNDAMDNIVVDLQEKASNGVDIEVLVLSFARHINWMYKDPVNISDFTWKPLSVGGMTSLGEACCELAKALASHKYDEDIAIVLLSDGCPTDDYESGIFELQQQPHFNHATKYAIALGNDADMNLLMKFVGRQEYIFKDNKADSLLDVLDSIIHNIIPDEPQTQISSADSADDWD